ncbi:insulin-degrading enzyme [Anopheles maculipalpis]|uniref:insulin-degrading enzyme n=1 Tax=Anopheles maculipalpis TaxID=1496333 RepID=UPI002159AD68|nr:insulin-degrading enzyme [Anopheles maculipalpis]
MLTQVVLRSTYLVYRQIINRNANTLCNIQLGKSLVYRTTNTIRAVHNNRTVIKRNVVAFPNMATELTSKAQLSNASMSLPQSTANVPFERINTITKSIQDNRDYRGLRLSNGMKVVLISDPTTDISAAALSVAVGHLSDPLEIPGLAHLCEHMLFLGTEKYPNEDEYTTFLKTHGGNSNAATCSDMTKYYFDVIPGKLEEALDRFSQFFIAPLFNEEVTEREINAVNSEHEKNVSQDVWRIKQVTKSLCKSSHPYSRFGTGNKQTLSESPKRNNINVRNELIKFCNTWYSSNIMSLAVFGQESLDELEAMVIKIFSQIENRQIVAPRWPDMPYRNEDLSTKTYIIPVKDIRSLTISFQMEDLEQYYKAGPEHYVSHLIGHEGKGSILSELKARGWCNKLSSGYCSLGRGFGSFDVMVDLTEDGFNHIDDTAKLIFQYIHMLRVKKPQKWIFEEYCNLCEMVFRFKDKEYPSTLVTNVVSSMHLFPLEDVLVAHCLITEWRPDLVEDLISKLTPDKARLVIVGQKCESLANAEERWYGTKYGVYKIEPSVLEYWSTPDLNDNLSLPEPNPFIPTDFELLPVDSGLENFPIVIQDTPIIRTWFKQDVEFLKPKALMSFDFNSPIVYANPLNCNLTRLFVQLLKDHLNEFLFEADLAGLGFGVSNTTSGISLSIGGYSHKQVILLEKVLDSMFNFKIDRRRFEILKEQYVRSLKNYQTEQPYQHAIYYLALLLTEQAWTRQELLDSTQLLSLERLQTFIEQLLAQMHVECFIYGNVNKEKALQMTRLVEDKMKYTDATLVPLLARQLLPKREYKIGKGESFLFEATNEFHKSSCMELYLQCGPQEPHSIFVDILSQLLSEKCYTQLRTKEQLGYVVYCRSRKANGICGLRIIVQSLRHPTYVEERIENFLNNMLEYLENLTDSEFDRHKEALVALFLEKPKRLITQFNIFIQEISLRQYHFNRAQVEAEKLRTLTKQQVIDYYKEHIILGAPSRSTLSVHVISTADRDAGIRTPDAEEPPAEAEVTDSTVVLNVAKKNLIRVPDLASFKSSRSLYPLAQPYMEVLPKGGRCKL